VYICSAAKTERAPMFRSPRFQGYVDAALEGSNALWRTVLGWLLILLVWFGAVYLAVFAIGASDQMLGDPQQLTVHLTSSPTGVAAFLISFLPIWPAVWLALRLLHRRSLKTVLGTRHRLSWPDLARGAAAASIASIFAEAAMLLVDPSLQRGSIGIGEWFVLMVPLAALILVQVSAEELAFRGYLVQSLAARFRNPLAWGVLPGLLFTLLHWDTASLPWMNVVKLLAVAAFAATATILVYLTGNLGAAMGVHLGMNSVSILVVSHASWLSSAALFVSRPLEAESWTVGETAAVGVISLAVYPIVLWLLVSSRSLLVVTKGGPSLNS
jgi:membrane protease YdiL (CAAX protease family)